MIKRVKLFSICSSTYIFLFLAFNNFSNTSYPWVLFCIPPLIIWPVMVCLRSHESGSRRFHRDVWPAAECAPHRFSLGLAWVMAAVVSVYYVILNIILADRFPWSFFIIFALIWYPCSLKFARRPFALSVFGFLWAVLFFSLLNAITTPNEIWAIYPIFGVLWWPLSVYFFKEKQRFI